MENNTKIAIGLAAAVVVGYIVYKSSKPKSSSANTKDPYLCPAGYKLTPYPMGRLVGEICKDSKGKTAEKQPNPNYVGTKEPNSSSDYGYMPSEVTQEEIERLEADRRTLGSMATLFDSQEKPNTYQEVYNTSKVRDSINIADLDCDRVGDVRKNCTNVKNQLIYTYTPPMSWNNSIIMPAQYTLETDNMFYEYDVNGNFVRWSPKLDRDRYSILK